MNLSTFRKSFMMVTLALLTSLVMWGCGSDSYNAPTTATSTPIEGYTTNVLIDADTLKGWMDQGLVNAPNSFAGKVVILTVGAKSAYDAGHIPGALPWDSSAELNMTRLEALSPLGTMVLDGAMMDTIIQRSGIDANTTIVLTHPSGNSMNTARAYFALRYWGFPRECIKVLNGGNLAWTAAGYTEATETSEVAASTYSVRNNGTLRADLRYSLGEMLQAVDANADTFAYNILDARGGTDYISTTLGTGYSFQGHIANSLYDNHGAYYADVTGDTDGTVTSGFKTEEAIRTYLASLTNSEDATLAFDDSLPTITYCVSGMRAAVPFFALDAILGLDVALYDGSWMQWGKYGQNAVTIATAWRTNTVRSVITSTTPTAEQQSDLVIDPVLNALYSSPADGRANQIENEDEAYMAVGQDEAPPTSTGGGSDSGC